jgi:glucosamine--fructose-6-phosphate aminotransferase (isomerizing)
MSMVDKQSLVVGLVHEASKGQQLAVLRDMKTLGARTLGLLEQDEGGGTGCLDDSVLFRSGIPEIWRAPLYLPVLQLTAYERAMHKGLNPDLPTNLTAVVVLNDRLE